MPKSQAAIAAKKAEEEARKQLLASRGEDQTTVSPTPKPVASKPARPKIKLSIPMIDALLWPVTIVLWFLTADGWPWLVAIIIRVGWWGYAKVKPHLKSPSPKPSSPKMPKMPKLPKFDKVQLGWIDLVWPVALVWWFMTAETTPWFIAAAIRIYWWLTRQNGKSVLGAQLDKVPPGVRKNAATTAASGGCLVFGVKVGAAFIATFVLYQFLGLFGLVVGAIASIFFLRNPGQPEVKADGTMVLPKPWLRALILMPAILFEHNTISKDGLRFGFRFAGFDKRSNVDPKALARLNVDDTLVDWLFGAAVVRVSDTGGKGVKEIRVARWADTETMEKDMKKAGGSSSAAPEAKKE